MATNQPQWLRKFKAQAAASPGKAALLGVLGVVFVVVMIVQFARAPGSAQAAAPPEPAPLPSVPEEMSAEAPVAPDSAEQAFVPPVRPACPQLVGNLSRDPFSLNWGQYFPEEPTAALQELEVLNAPEEGREPEPEDFMLEATFRTNVLGAEPSAIINGFKVGVNDRLGRYLVKAIGPRHVVLADQDREVVVRMP